LNIEAQREAAPLRRIYEAEEVEPMRAVTNDRIDAIRALYRERKEEIADSQLSTEERLDKSRDALRAMRKDIATAYSDLKPQQFGEWLQTRNEGRDRVWEAHMDRSRQEDQSQEQEPEQRAGRLEGQFAHAERSTGEQSRGLER